MARWFIIAGILMIFTGFIIHYVPWIFNWFGRLPGDIRYESGRTRIYIPIISMILISIFLTLLVNVIRRFL